MNQSNQSLQISKNNSFSEKTPFSSRFSSADLLNLKSKWLTVYGVVFGGYGQNQLYPVVPYARFLTLAEAERFKANVSLDYPDCRVSSVNYQTPGTEEELNKFLNSIFFADFSLIVNIDDFDPKVKRGNQLLMRRSISPQIGDIIAIGHGDNLCRHIAHYQPGSDWFAVCVEIIGEEQLNQSEEVV